MVAVVLSVAALVPGASALQYYGEFGGIWDPGSPGFDGIISGDSANSGGFLEYPQPDGTSWYNGWWYNGLDPDGHKEIHVIAAIGVVDWELDSSLEITVNWSGPQYSAPIWPLPIIDEPSIVRAESIILEGYPLIFDPLPGSEGEGEGEGDSASLDRDWWWVNEQVYSDPNTTNLSVTPDLDLVFIDWTLDIPYCPEWISIDLRGDNFWVEGSIWHECLDCEVPEPASMALLGMGLLGMTARRLRKRS